MIVPLVLVILGSETDEEAFALSKAPDILDFVLGKNRGKRRWKLCYISADRDRETLERYCPGCYGEGTKVFIGVAGLSPALPGAIRSVLPKDATVIGVPLGSNAYEMDKGLLDLTNKPFGSGVVVVGAGKTGLGNAALEACRSVAQTKGRTSAGVRRRLLAWYEQLAVSKQPQIDVNVDEVLRKHRKEVKA